MSGTRKRKLDVDAPAAGYNSKGGPEVPLINPHTSRPYSQRYYDILSKRQGEAQGKCLPSIICSVPHSVCFRLLPIDCTPNGGPGYEL